MATVPRQWLTDRLQTLRALRSDSGLFLAAAKGVATGYDKAWLRDNIYTALAFEWAGDKTSVHRVYRALLDVFKKHEDKIVLATKEKPRETWQYIHARYHPETFEEFWTEWGNKQNDAIGAFLFKLGDLEEKQYGIVESDDDRRIIQHLVNYLGTLEYWHDPDNGIWEEAEELHASSIGACVAGLKKVSALSYINVPPELITRGEEALKQLLPRESQAKFCDLALLSLAFPYEILPRDVEDQILENLEYHLVKLRGVLRYKTDRYYNKNKQDGWSEEAEWTMGFPWLAIIYARRGNLVKARYYLDRTSDLLVDGQLPELFFSNSKEPNENIPLGWAESMYVLAMIEVTLRES